MAQETDSNAAALHATPYGTLPPASPMPNRKPISLPRLLEMRTRGEKITMITAYDATFAAVADAAGIESILVGDSLGMVCQGLHTTVGVTLEHMRYHTEMVSRGLRRAQATAWLIGDLPFGAYQESKEQAIRSASVLMQAGAHMVKLEGGGWTTETVRFLVERGIPVCAHLGLTPQTVHSLGGYRVQGKTQLSADTLKRQAHELQDAGASMLVLEMVPAPLSAELTVELAHCATIGIGAGKGTAGQVLVMHDMLGLNLGKNPKFVRNFMDEATTIRGAFEAYVAAVKGGNFPDDTLHAW
jgi:3-methyl-2-oxobutanoate hydroxymethyltransferase